MAALHREKIEADRTGPGAFGTKPMADRFPGVFRHQAFSSVLAFSCSRKASRVDRNTAANSAQALDGLMSTMRTASMRARGRSKEVRALPALDAAPELLLGG